MITEKSHQPKKKQKIDSEKYISVRTVWGPPTTCAPKKQKLEETESNTEPKMKRKKGEKEIITNIKRIEDRIWYGESFKGDFEIEHTDWEKVIQEHKERLEKETKERESNIERKEIKEKSWQLYKECQKFLENNEKNWEKLKIEREQERKRKERLSLARGKQEKLQDKIKERKLEKEIQEGMNKLPQQKRNEILIEENRKQKMEIIETKKSLWKLRKKETKQERKSERTLRLEKIEKMEDKLEIIEKILSELKVERENRKQLEEKRKEAATEEWRKKIRAKDRKERERKEKIDLENRIAQHWEMYKWVTTYIDENKESWEKERELKEIEAQKELREWEKMKRMEKIQHLKKKWQKESCRIEPTPTPPPPLPKLTLKMRGRVRIGQYGEAEVQPP